MSGIKIGRFPASLMRPHVQAYDIAASQVIYAGDLVVLTGVNSITRVRKLTAADITNNYTESSVVKGILGMAMNDASTDANGYAIYPITPGTVQATTRPIYPLPNYAAGIAADPVAGVSKLNVAVADGFVEFAPRIATTSNANVTVTDNTIGTPTGFQVVNTVDFSANIGASGAGLCAIISGVDEVDPNFNVAANICRAYVRILPAYQQFSIGNLYAS